MSKEASDYQHDYEVHKINKKQINKDSTTYKSNNFSKKQPQYSDIIQIARLEEDKKFLKEELINLRAILKDTQINENKKFSDLQNKYEDLLTKFNSIQEELNEVKNNESFYEDINKKLKNFILNSF